VKRLISIIPVLIVVLALAITSVPTPVQAQEPVTWTDPDLPQELPVQHTVDPPFLADKVSILINCSGPSHFYIELYNEQGELVHYFSFESFESGILEVEEFVPGGDMIAAYKIIGGIGILDRFTLYSPIVWIDYPGEPLPVSRQLDTPVLANKVGISIECSGASEFYVALYNEQGQAVDEFLVQSSGQGLLEVEEFLPEDYLIASYEIMQAGGFGAILLEFRLYYLTLPVHIHSEGPSEVRNGDTIEIHTVWNKPGYSIIAYLDAIDSGFDPGDVTVEDMGHGYYIITYTVTEGNTIENGSYPVPIEAINSQGYYTILYESLFILLNNEPVQSSLTVLSRTPPANELDVACSANITVQFNTSIDSTTVTVTPAVVPPTSPSTPPLASKSARRSPQSLPPAFGVKMAPHWQTPSPGSLWWWRLTGQPILPNGRPWAMQAALVLPLETLTVTVTSMPSWPMRPWIPMRQPTGCG